MFAQNQWVRLSVVLLIALLARVALGDTQTDARNLTVEVNRPSHSRLDVSVGPGAVAWSSSLGSTTGVVANLGAMYLISQSAPLYIGADFGLGFLSVSPIFNATYIRLTPSLLYKVELPKSQSVHPYFGVSMGPNITVLNGDVAGVKTTDTKVYFEGLTRLGVGFDLTPELGVSVETKVGILGGDVIFLPSSLLVFSI